MSERTAGGYAALNGAGGNNKLVRPGITPIGFESHLGYKKEFFDIKILSGSNVKVTS
jgi:hypothetical protein